MDATDHKLIVVGVGVLLLVAAALGWVYDAVKEREADARLAAEAVQALVYAESLTMQSIEPRSYAAAVQAISLTSDAYLSSQAARRNLPIALRVDRARLAYVVAYRLWLAEDASDNPTVGAVAEASDALVTFPGLAPTVEGSGTVARFRDVDGALDVLWSEGANDTAALIGALRRRGYEGSLETTAPPFLR